MLKFRKHPTEEQRKLAELIRLADNILVNRFGALSRVTFTIGLRNFATVGKIKFGYKAIQVFECCEESDKDKLLGEYHFDSWTLEFLRSSHISKEEIEVFLVTERLNGALPNVE